MADKRWRGSAQAVADEHTITIAGTWATSDTATITINDKSVVVTIGANVTTAQVATTIKQAWENETLTDTTASVSPATGGQAFVEHSALTATVNGSVVTLVNDVLGEPVTINVTESTAGSGTATEANSVAATGPNFWSDPDNWEPTGVPAADDVYIENSTVDILYGLSQGSAALTSLTIAGSYEGKVGLPRQNPAGYVEYRTEFLQVTTAKLSIGVGSGQGSGRLKIDTHNTACAATVVGTGVAAEPGIPALILKGDHASNTLTVHGGDVGLSYYGDDSAQFPTIVQTGGTMVIGGDATITTITKSGGTLTTESNLTTLNNSNGPVGVDKEATVTTVNVTGGEFIHRTTGTIGTFNLGGTTVPALLNADDTPGGTITTLTASSLSNIRDPHRLLVLTNDTARGSDVRAWSFE